VSGQSVAAVVVAAGDEANVAAGTMRPAPNALIVSNPVMRRRRWFRKTSSLLEYPAVSAGLDVVRMPSRL
jgi:hypothetical protein